MPELPEVENVRLSLQSLGAEGQTFVAAELLRANLRTPLQRGLVEELPGQTILRLTRRAKFLLFETKQHILLSHLGMTGSWRVYSSPQLVETQTHDHVRLRFQSGMCLIYNDPRRFGLLELIAKPQVPTSRWLKSLGVEPLEDEFTSEYLFKATRKIKAPIKNFIMDQKRVVGVGNIYASEALFAAKIRPTRAAGRVSKAEAQVLVECIRKILRQAIAAGGSTIRDYRNSNGDSGSFQQRFKVYDRAGEKCVQCKQPIRAKFIAGRNTFWCHQCQS
jgi:formamidopyrimidine-DNA glycosylase